MFKSWIYIVAMKEGGGGNEGRGGGERGRGRENKHLDQYMV